ncbi:MAG TPA: SPW repeat protein [Stellaceae bacterium]|nr:SPW repeat protein [Stellaceae bacterium]
MASSADFAGSGKRSNRWQDWTNLVLGLWLFISPWVLRYASGAATAPAGGGAGAAATGGPAGSVVGMAAAGANASWNAWVLGALIALLSISALARMEFWQEWINLLLGVWVFIAPWVLGFVALAAAAWDHWVVGALVFLIAICNVAAARRQIRALHGESAAYAGDKPKR